MAVIRHDWTVAEIRELHDLPITDLVFRAQQVHREHQAADEVQLCTLLSVKTGGCVEDCAYCPQSSRHATSVTPERFLSVEEVLSKARAAKEAGSTRFCMGAAWRDAKEGPAFEKILAMVRGVRALEMEACVTLGMLNESQAAQLQEAGLTAYNHNLDSSKEFYGEIITTRTYEERLDTLQKVRSAGLQVCSGGIIGMGETLGDRCAMIATLAALDPHPESVPVNALVPVKGTPLGDRDQVDPLELVRMCAVARIVMPAARVRLSAGRTQLTREAQVMCFLAGANSIFYGEKLLTTGNPEVEADLALLRDAGMKPLTLDGEPMGRGASERDGDEARLPRDQHPTGDEPRVL